MANSLGWLVLLSAACGFDESPTVPKACPPNDPQCQSSSASSREPTGGTSGKAGVGMAGTGGRGGAGGGAGGGSGTGGSSGAAGSGMGGAGAPGQAWMGGTSTGRPKSSGLPGSPYSLCTSDAMCLDGVPCTDTAGGFCGPVCQRDEDCPLPPTGDTVPTCNQIALPPRCFLSGCSEAADCPPPQTCMPVPIYGVACFAPK